MSFDVIPLTSAIGAEIRGIDLRKPLDVASFARLERALLEHMVLFFREQPITPDEQVALARRFGEIEVHPFGRHLDEHPLVGVLDQSEPQRDGANRWHADSTFMERPPKVAVLHAVRLPATGGDTTWVSMAHAYEALSAPLRSVLESMTATHDVTGPLVRAVQSGHSVSGIEEIQKAWPPRSHPIVCRHPDTGRKMLYVNSNFTTRIDGVSERESEALLGLLLEWIRSPEFQVRFRWAPDSVALWDNRATQHFAVADYRERRIMHRVTVAGDWQPGEA